MKKNNNEKGFALILTLGMLTLLLVMGMAFSFSARVNKKLSSIRTDEVKTKLIATSATSTALALLKEQETYFIDHNENEVTYMSQMYEKSSTAKTRNLGGIDVSVVLDENLKKILGTDVTMQADSTAISASPFIAAALTKDTKLTSVGTSTVVPVFSLDGSTNVNATCFAKNLEDLQKVGYYTIYNKDKEIIGRYNAFLINDTGKIDLNAAAFTSLAPRVNEDYQTAYTPKIVDSTQDKQFYYNIYGDYSTSTSSNRTKKFGLSMHELAETGSSTTPQWISYQQMAKNSQNTNKYTFWSPTVDESYWDKATATGRHRFDITGFEWRMREDKEDDDIDEYYDANNIPVSDYNWSSHSSDYKRAQSHARHLVESLTSCSARPEFVRDEDGYVVKTYQFSPWAYRTFILKYLDLRSFKIKDYAFRHYFYRDDEPYNVDPEFGIPYLKGQTQIAANMVDYCDKDDYATLMFPNEDNNKLVLPRSILGFYKENLPTYVGNERVHYINEVAFSTSATCKCIMESKLQYKNKKLITVYRYICYITVKFKPTVELVNIYPMAGVPAGEGSLFVFGSGSVSFDGDTVEIGKGAGNESLLKSWNSTDNPIELNSRSMPASSTIGYASKDFGEITLANSQEFVSDWSEKKDPPEIVVDVRMKRVLAATHNDEKIYDLAEWNSPNERSIMKTSGNNWYTAPTKTGILRAQTSTMNAAATIEAADPRCNYRFGSEELGNGDTPSDTSCPMVLKYNSGKSCYFWTSNDSPDYASLGSSINRDNSNMVRNGDGKTRDKESGVTFEGSYKKTYSTAFIRNSPFEGLWELGLIHRGGIGQTVNLKKFTDRNTIGEYSDGDAALLDQVKVGPADVVVGKISISHLNKESIETLVDGVGFSNLTNGTLVVPSNKKNFYNQIGSSKSINKDDLTAITSIDCQNRAKIAEAFSEVIEDEPNDLSQEAYVGMTANLLETRYKMMTLVVTAQSIKEFKGIDAKSFKAMKRLVLNPTVYATAEQSVVSNNPSDIRIGKEYNLHFCSVLSTHINIVTVVYDSWTKTFEIVQSETLYY